MDIAFDIAIMAFTGLSLAAAAALSRSGSSAADSAWIAFVVGIICCAVVAS